MCDDGPEPSAPPRGWPRATASPFRNSLMASSFRMESLMMIPHVTISPMADIRFRVCPHIHNRNRANATSIGISSSTMSGCTKLSNWAARMKYISRDRDEKNHHQLVQHLAVEKKPPEKAVSQSPVASASRFTFPSTPEHRPLHRNGTVYIHRCVLP